MVDVDSSGSSQRPSVPDIHISLVGDSVSAGNSKDQRKSSVIAPSLTGDVARPVMVNSMRKLSSVSTTSTISSSLQSEGSDFQPPNVVVWCLVLLVKKCVYERVQTQVDDLNI